MKVYLLTTEDGSPLFYAKGGDEAGTHPVPHGGLRGWVERKAQRLKSAWTHPGHGLSPRLRRAWDWLQRRIPADESMLVRLRSARTIEIHHPTTLSSTEARALWEDYLARRARRHWPWLATNTLVSPLTVALAPLPGPNVVGYWFAYRAVRHLLALLGVRHARKLAGSTTFHPAEALDRPTRGGREGTADRAFLGADAEGLDAFLERSGGQPEEGRRAIGCEAP